MASVCDSHATCLLISTVTLLLSLIGLIFVAVVLYLHHQHRKYAHIPSPPRDGFFTGHLATLRRYNKRGLPFTQILVDVMHEYGPVFCLMMMHMPFVHLLDSAAVKDILFSKSHLKPAVTYRFFSRVFGARFLGSGLVSEIDPFKHGKRRLLMNPMFTRKHLVNFVDQFNASADVLIEKLRHKADGKTEVVMLDELNRTTLDVIAKVAFGMELNCTLDENVPFNQAVTTALKGMATSFKTPSSEWSPLPAARRFRQEVRDNVNVLRETGRRYITEKLEVLAKEDDTPNDIFTLFLKESIKLEEDDRITMDEFIDEFVTLFIGGQETTANLLSFCLVELGNHPEIMHRLRTEVEAVLGDRDHLEMADVTKLTYTMQVLKETLRLWPPVSGTLRQLGHDVTVRGYAIPSGTIVGLNSYAMARMEEYFHDPLQFDPDRFKASDDRPQYAYFPFSLGPRNCIGQQFALIESRVLLARLLQKFHFDLVPGQGYTVNDEITMKPLNRCKNYLRLVDSS